MTRFAAELDEELERWRTRKLDATRYIALDATDVKVRHDGSVIECTVLTAAGERTDGKRCSLGGSISLSEAEVHWQAFLVYLVDRGLRGVELITSDNPGGLKTAPRAFLPSVCWQRCQRNAASYVPKARMRGRVARGIRSIFNAPAPRPPSSRPEEVRPHLPAKLSFLDQIGTRGTRFRP